MIRRDDMSKQAKITYMLHSGFIVELDKTVLVFDYFKDPHHDIIPAMQTGKQIYVFSSHVHYDHFNPVISSFQEHVAQYFLSFDIKQNPEVEKIDAKKVKYLDIYDEYTSDIIKVRSFSSTDAGISFLVEVEGWNIFHAGDFNWWHWKGDTEENNSLAKNGFMKQMKKLDGLEADVAFFPVDLRLEEFCDLGVKEFCRRTTIKQLVTMHNAQNAPWVPSQDLFEAGKDIPLWIPGKPGETIQIIKQES